MTNIIEQSLSLFIKKSQRNRAKQQTNCMNTLIVAELGPLKGERLKYINT